MWDVAPEIWVSREPASPLFGLIQKWEVPDCFLLRDHSQNGSK